MFLQEELYFENEYNTYSIRFLKLVGISIYETSLFQMIHVYLFNTIIALASFAQIKRLLLRIKTDWNNVTSEPELMILKKYANRSRQWTIIIANFIISVAFYLYIMILMFPSVISVILYIFGELDVTELVLPVPFDYFLKDQVHFYFTLFIEYTCLIVLSTIGITHYSIFVSFVQHACALFNIVA
ncbi:uncharacterized protein LOC124432359 [Vespa crabro]|uniref:uncharacterized protein LOC124432359 n=1 Tax=Vespa crabro TaxID=7445 RepID=UPI001F02FDD9|nr:uncharacterized protein LOC124432359 [Vespa crabro]